MYITALLPLALLPLSYAKDIPVTVGQGSLNFGPKDVTAAKDDTITFTFYPRNHSVAQSSFDKPCAPIDNAVFSGFIPVEGSGPGDKTFKITIKDDKPIWLYCSYDDHCQGGMVMAINAPKSGNTLDAYTQASNKASENLSPAKVNDELSSGGSSSSGSSSATGSSKTSATGTASTTGSSTKATTGSATGASTGTSSSTTASPTSNVAGQMNAGLGMGVLGLLGVVAGGMI